MSSLGKIFQLDEQLSNKIAAGEVVERPASVVKELVENSIDAGSTSIQIDVEEGGLSLIRVLDNGNGIEAEDVETAFYRHATSKIRHDRDLFRIVTLGFRGEALPSIASVSKLALKTSDGKAKGHEIRLEGGKIVHKGSAAARKGTEIAVSELFYNTPARLKYLRTIHTELGHISDVVNRMAIAHPEIAFHLTHNGKMLLQTTGNGDLLRVIAAIYGTQTAKKMLPISAESLDFQVGGYIAKPEVTRSNRSYMSTIINGRYIRNYPLMKAIQEGYHTLLPIGKYPVAVLQIKMDPILIDVNVHPSKLEVRISKEQALQQLVTEGIKKLFQQTRLIPEVSLPRKAKPQSEQLSLKLQHEPAAAATGAFAADKQEEAKTEWTRKTAAPGTEKAAPPERAEENVYTEASAVQVHGLELPTSVAEEADAAVDFSAATQQTVKETVADNIHISLQETECPAELPQDEQEPGKEGKEVPVLYPIGQLHGTYILAQNDQGLYIIDQHAAQERIKYEYFRDKIAEVEPLLQDLLVPLTIELTQSEDERLKERGHLLKEVGIHLEPFGSRTYLVRSHPTWFPKGQEQEVIEEMLEQLKEQPSIDIAKLREDAAILMSCKAAIKANRYLTKEEMFSLLETLRMCEEPYTCPHGRPVIIHYSTYEMERMFKRVM